MHDRPRSGAVTSSGASLIAWLSLCLLAAAWGRTFDESLQTLWSEIGAFGLAAAVGLEAIHRARLIHESRARERATRKRVEHGLTQLREQSATLDAMNVALRKLVEDVARRKGPQDCASGWTRRHCEAAILRKYPLEITCLDDADLASNRAAAPMKGFVRHLTSNSISFEHADPLATKVLVANFELARGERFSVVVDVLWTERDGHGYLSGGTVLAAGAPDETGEQDALVENVA